MATDAPGFFQGTEMPSSGWNWHRRLRAETTVLGEPRGPRDALRLAEIPPYHYAAVFSRREE